MSGVLGLVGIAAILFVAWGAFSAFAFAVTRRASAAFPTAIALTCQGGVSLNRALEHWYNGPARLPLSFTLLATDDGLSIWTLTKSPIVSVEWKNVVSIETTVVQQGNRNSRGISVRVESGGEETTLPIILLGRGLFWTAPKTSDEIIQVREQLETLRELHRGPDSTRQERSYG